jgi:hypothetical protein
MRKFIILLSMSLCTFAEAQKALEWQVKLGLYSDIYSLPEIRDAFYWQFRGNRTYVYPTTSIGLEIKKWSVLIQLNVDSKITFRNSNFDWKIDYANSGRVDKKTFVPRVVGDLMEFSYSYFSILNAMYRISKVEDNYKIYLGFGLLGRFESVSYITFISDPVTGFPILVDGYNKYRYAPALKAEYQYNVSKKFFLSTHVLYGFFDETPHSYWQFALNAGIRF